MSFSNVACNECGNEIKQRQTRQIVEALPSIRTESGRIRKFSLQWLLTGAEYEIQMISSKDSMGNLLPAMQQEMMIVIPEEFDICPSCQLKHLLEAVEIIKTRLGV